MATKLVIVESPAKAKTINNYLGSDYNVLASFGHVRDLPSSVLGVDVEHDFEPKYIIPAKSKKQSTIIKFEDFESPRAHALRLAASFFNFGL